MKTLNIGHNYFIVGGSDRVLIETVKLMSSHGHTAIPFCCADEKNLPSEYSKYFPSSISTDGSNPLDIIQYFYNHDAVVKLEYLLDEHPEIEIAHLHIYYGKITTSVLKVLKKRNIKIVQSLHEYKLVCPVYTMQRDGDVCDKCLDGSFYNCIRYRCKDNSFIKSSIVTLESYFSRYMGDVTLIDKFISVSHFHRTIMIKGGVPDSKISVLHNFVDTNVVTKTLKHKGYFLYFGRIEKLKGIDTLIEAFKQSHHRLIIVGDGSYVENMKSKIEHLDNIEYAGFQEGDVLATTIRNCVAVIVPSEWYENCPMNVLEAKAYGKPVLGCDIGGIPELVDDGKDGYIIPVRDSEALVNKLDYLVRDYESLASQSLDNCVINFSDTAHYNKLMAIYDSLLKF
ncbi:glycosyltransferase family 4 protein [Vibrio breoganii]